MAERIVLKASLKADSGLLQVMIDEIVNKLEKNGVVKLVRDGDCAIAETDEWRMLVDGNSALIVTKSPNDDTEENVADQRQESLDWFRGKMNG